ncbi:MAG: right-handed parallel beta-helix repeat-containing protein [Leptospiraceae bacterium]|nr:right-handed parallel beta-helix repeat-containing protein [Leptospiraceae bacterium]
MQCKEEIAISADDAEFEEMLREELVSAKPGKVIKLPAGKFQLSAGLTMIGKHGITIRGAGMDKTILSFQGQKQGAEGLMVKGNDFTIEDLAIEDSKGDTLKIEGGQNITIRRVRTEWTNGPDENNGAYGIYPVQCQNVLIEHSTAIGASDAGIYVGQSRNIIVRHNTARLNVAGIEIENSQFADVHDNTATENTGGILVFDLPDLPVQGGQNTRVYKNKIINNNTANFAPSGNIVGRVPTGTGVMIMANDNIEIFENQIENHKTTGLVIVSYYITENEIKDAKYDPTPEAIYVHNNQFAKNGYDPTGGSAFQSKKIVTALSFKLGEPFPDVLYDGVLSEKLARDNQLPADKRICLQHNGSIQFANLDAANDFANIKRDLGTHDCELKPLQAIKW